MRRFYRHINHAACYALVIALGKGISLLMLPVITHALPVMEYGRLELMVAIADMGGILLGFSLVDALFRFAGSADSEKESQAKAASIFGLCLCLAISGLLIGQLTVPLLLSLLPESIIEIELRILLVTLSLTATIQVPLAWLRMQNHITRYCLLFGGKALLQAGLIWAALHKGYGVMGILMAGLAADLLLCVILCLLQYRDTSIRLYWPELKQILPYNLPLILGALACCLLGSFDRFLLAPAVGQEALAHYALAGKFALMVALMAEPFNMWWFPRRFKMLKETDGALRSARSVMLGVGYITAAAMIVSLTAPWLIIWLTPASYHDAGDWVPLLCGIAALHAITNLMNIGVYAGKTGWMPSAINIASAVIALAGYLLLIPSYGVSGAVGATYLAFAIRFILFLSLSQRRIPIPYLRGIASLCGNPLMFRRYCHDLS
ncbi:MAG: lipopolysaccharide biosynthesis protein [Rickettsiales bacterium]|nr:lipopolysaccharide biosynthesis protein [Rickettsiales bacterium]